MPEDRVVMTQRDLQRLSMLQAVRTKTITQREASQCLGLSTRQVRRLQRRVQHAGATGLVHRSRGRPSPRRLPATLQARALALIRTRYRDFGPTLACEHLAVSHRLRVSVETLRHWMRRAGLWISRRAARPRHAWRERRACVGAMIQLDGSHHAWLEGRGPRLVLMAYIDDATNRLWARFYPAEGLVAAMDSFRRYCRRYGIPQSVYLDRHTTYKAYRQPTLAEQLAGRQPQSQFERALAELGVRVIHAYSPQAKGRVERVFKTLQDRLVKVLRLAGARTRAEANHVLGGYLGPHNRRFTVAARQPGDLHRPVPSTRSLRQILGVQRTRTVAPDGTFQFQGQRLQLPPTVRPPRVVITQSLTGRLLAIRDDAQRRVSARPVTVVRLRPRRQPHGWQKRHWRPAASHPWRQAPVGA